MGAIIQCLKHQPIIYIKHTYMTGELQKEKKNIYISTNFQMCKTRRKKRI